MIILGVDPGSVVTGYGILETEGNRYRLLDAAPIRLKKAGDLPDRLVVLAQTLDDVIQKYQPNVLAVEKVFHGVNFNSTLILGQVRGVVLLCAAKAGLSVAEYAPKEMKKAVTGNGSAEKAQVQEMVRILLNLREVLKPNDVADAVALAICHAHRAPVAQAYRMAQRR